MTFHEGDLRRICWGEVEIIRRICALVRGRNWETLPRSITGLAVRDYNDSFSIACDLESRQEEADFRFQIRIDGSPDGTIDYRFAGSACAAFLANRIGLCVLQPIAEYSGTPLSVIKTNGELEDLYFPDEIAPFPLFTDAREIRCRIADDLKVKISLSGDAFEAEDQRNWTDTSFKTYSRPLRLPYPFQVDKGATFAQSATVSLYGSRSRNTSVAARASEIAVHVSALQGRRFPQIGLGLATGDAPSAESLSRLRDLNLSFLTLSCGQGNSSTSKVVKAAVSQAKMLNLPLEIRLPFHAGKWHREQHAVRRLLDGCEVSRWLIDVDAGFPASSRPDRDGEPVFFGSSRGFVEVNRNPAVAQYGDGVWFAIDPQVHASDDDSLVENLAGQGSVVEQASRLAIGSPVAISPVALKLPYGNDQGDPRQGSLLAAAWTVGSLKYLAQAGAGSVSYFETIGPGGVMPFSRPLNIQEAGFAERAAVYPVFHVFAELAEFRAGDALASMSSHPLLVECLALRSGSRIRLMLANLSEEDQQVRLEIDGASTWTSAKCLDATTFPQAAVDPRGYRETLLASPRSSSTQVRLSLPPFAVMTVDGSLEESADLFPGGRRR